MSKNLIRVLSAEYIRKYQIRLRFSDGAEKVVDFSRWLHGEVFQPLVEMRTFRRFFIAGGTVCWPNGADIAPETLRESEDAARTEAEYEELWVEEGEARYADFQAGKTSAIDGDEVFARARAKSR